MVTIPKAGDPRQCSNHRAVQTASGVGKVYSKILRRSLVTFFENYARADQHGGVKGRGTEIASLPARVLMRRFSQIGKSFAMLSLLMPAVPVILCSRNRCWVRWIKRVPSTMCWRKFLLSSQTCWLKRRGTERRSGMISAQLSRRQAWVTTSFVWSIGSVASGFRSRWFDTQRVARKARDQVTAGRHHFQFWNDVHTVEVGQMQG